MFYVIETENVGPNSQDSHYIDTHTYHIQTCPGVGNSSREPIIEGWLGTSVDWSEYAHGEYETLEDAKDKIEELTGGEYREQDLDEHDCIIKMDDEGNTLDCIVYSVKVGKLEPWTAASSQDWCYESMWESIDAVTSYAAIETWVQECMNTAEIEVQAELDADSIERMALKYRDDLRTDEFYQNAFTSASNWGKEDFEKFIAEIGFTDDDPDESFGQRAFAVWEWMTDEQKNNWIDTYNDWLDQ